MIYLTTASEFTPNEIWDYWSNNEDNKQISKNTAHNRLLSEIKILIKNDAIAFLGETN